MTKCCALYIPKIDREVPLRGINIEGNVTGNICQWQVSQSFINLEKTAIEAVYTFPLPSDAILHKLEIETGDKVIKAKIEEKEEAFEIYDEAINEGNAAFLLDQERPNIYVLSVGNLLPQQEVKVQISFIQAFENTKDGTRILFPATIAPKYTPHHMSPEDRSEWERIAPEHQSSVPYGMNFRLNISNPNGIKTIDSPSHPIRFEIGEDNATVTLSKENAETDKDIVINYLSKDHAKPSLFEGSYQDIKHLMVEFFPEFEAPETDQKNQVVFIVDCSGSMSGDSMREAKNALQLCIRSMSEGDLFQIILFGSDHRLMFKEPQTFNQPTLDLCTKEIAQIDANMGGTEILPALEDAFKQMRNNFNIVLLTDGQVSNEAEIISLAQSQRKKCRIFSFGIGNGASEYLVKGIAKATGGKSEFIFPDERIELKVLRLFSRINSPRLTNIQIDWGIKEYEACTNFYPEIYSGDVFRTAIKLKTEQQSLPKMVTLSADLGQEKQEWTAQLSKAENHAIPMWWAHEKINELENQAMGSTKGSQQNRKIKKDKTKEQIIDLSKAHNISSSHTSFIGVEEREEDEKNEGAPELIKVPMAFPQGWHGGFGAPPSPVLVRCAAAAPAPCFKSKRSAPPAAPASSAFASAGGLLDKAAALFDSLSEPECEEFDSDRSIGFAPPSAASAKSDTPEDVLSQILMLVRADGSFPYSDELLKLINVSESDLENLLKTISNKDLLINLLVKHKLITDYPDLEPMWAGIVKKQKSWLAKQNYNTPENLLEDYFSQAQAASNS
jgi:Ca-activated chloride channel family protein